MNIWGWILIISCFIEIGYRIGKYGQPKEPPNYGWEDIVSFLVTFGLILLALGVINF